MTSPEEFSCIFCKESFESKEELQIHFRKHGDPKFNPSVKNSKGKVQSEMSAGGEKGEETEMVRCDVCEEEFPTISKAITHKHKVHPDHDAKYFCPWCGKLFTMKHLYNKHIQSVHESAEQNADTGFHCDYCEVDFFVPSAMLYHNKFFHRQDTELAAIGHSRKLKLFGQEPLQIYYCPFCGEEYFNKINLHKHMGDDHIDENQCPEDVLRCPLCDAVFYHLDAYELHLTFHSTDDMYGEENEMAKDITEFSLETVSPMMEKVENELQEGENAATWGIEELLQQAMNESNGESVREKKKKHKKHKRSKNAAITLDEFLNMNSDVFGEGLDVQGIVEVPTQVVAKSLKRKPGPKPLPTELQKLKKAGLVVKKNPTPVEGVKLANKKPTLRPGVKITSQGNIISSEMKKAAEAAAKPNVASTSNDILTRLLNQGNSQIKIIKKSAQGDSISEISATDKGPPVTDDTKKNTEMDSSTPNKDERLDDTSSTIKCMDGVSEVDSSIENHNDEENIENDAAVTYHDSSEHSLKGTTQVEGTIPESSNVRILNQDENIKESNKELNTSVTKNKSSVTALDALRNINQHLTIKSLQSTGVKILEQDHKNIEESDAEHKDEKQDTNTIQKDCKLYSPIADNKNKISPLKHLSHLTVKPINLSKNALSPSRNSDDLYKSEEKEENHEDLKTDDVDDCDNKISGKRDEDDNISTKTAVSVLNRPTNLDAFKNLSKHITIKSLSQSPNSFKNTVDKTVPGKSANQDINDSESGIDTDQVEKQNTINKDISNKPIVKQAIKTKSPTAKSPLPNHSPKKINRVQGENEVQIPEDQTSVKNEITANFLKQFPSITAKPLNAHKTVKQLADQTSSESMKILKGNSVQHNAKKIETSEEEIETFNIDDSDDEVPPPPATAPCIPLNAKKINSKHEDNKNTNDCKQVLKNLNKHISIKVLSQAAKEESQDDTFSDEDVNGKFTNETFAVKPQQKNIILENKLKNLSNLTVKSSNTSPKLSTATPKQKIDLKQFDEYDSDCSNTSGNVKITELPDDYTSDDDVPLKSIKKTKISNKDMGGADYTDSENENKAHQEDDDDIEDQITSTLLKKSNKPAFLNNLKNITIKSSKDRQMQEVEVSPDSTDENKVLVPFRPQNKPFQPSTSTTQEQRSPYEAKQNFGRPVKQNVSNCVNTVNKEVTVQKFQTKTVVQEITTTVTKTIRTINQSVKQEVRNVAQSAAMPTATQRVQGIRPQIRNFKGTPTRPVAPLMGTKIRNATPTRPPVNTNIRPSNQLVQIKPGVNLTRPNNPRMAGPKRFSQPSTSNSSNPIIRKPLKISPNVTFNKRPATDEVTGPFSCFKKVKESLIPFCDAEDSVAQFASSSSSQMSQSNYTSTTKVMKGNSIVTSTQMKTEMSASSEQIKKLNNMAGLKVVKSSQVKQASHVEERSNVTPAKRSAIEAIQKLQKQGLLVKKPKVEEPVVEEPDSEHEYSITEEGDDYCAT